MWKITGENDLYSRDCDGRTRRSFLRTGVIGGLTLPGFLRLRASSAAIAPIAGNKSVVLEKEIRLIHLGRIAQKKNIRLTVMSLLCDGLQRASLVIAGSGESKYKDRLQALVARLELQSRVEFTGPLEGLDKVQALSSSHIFVLPSSNENFAIAVAESIACLTPVVISKEVALSDFVIKHKCGEVLDSLSPESIALCIKTILNNYQTYVNACRNAREELDWAVVFRAWERN